MKIAVEGCAHGDIEKIYSAIQLLESKHSFKVDLLICCGDFQSIRNECDLECLAVPKRYRSMETFHKYYSGELVAPILTIFIGGNHEASNYLSELPYGGWVCPNIYYMGYANVVQIGGLRIGGLSGIYKGYNYTKGHFECFPYSEDTKRSAYHVRNLEIFRLKQISERLDIFISHDWPQGIYNYGRVGKLLRRKPFLQEEIERGVLGSAPAAELLHKLQPRYWFAAHLHVKFSAIVKHNDSQSETRFLALDKCLPHRNYLQILEVPHESHIPLNLCYDLEWLCILKSTNHLLSLTEGTHYMPGPGCNERFDFVPTKEELDEVCNVFQSDFTIPLNFVKTAPDYVPKCEISLQQNINPQSVTFCEKLDITYPLKILLQKQRLEANNLHNTNNEFTNDLVQNTNSFNPDEICVSDDDMDS